MSVFQYLAITLLTLLLVWELWSLWRRTTRRSVGILRVLVWLLAALAIAFPGAVQQVATAIGIGRGADAVLYLFVLVFLGSSFYFYSQQVRQQRQITELVRHIAIQEAQRGELR
jgi:hypothetical protein